MKELPVYEMLISEDDNSDLEVDFISLVDKPAIKRNFEAFLEPNKGEREKDFIPRCIAYVVGEGKDQSQAAAVCYSIWEQHFAADKVSFDWDETLSTPRGEELLKRRISEGATVYIISARGEVTDSMLTLADKYGIPHSRVYATGSNKAKEEKIAALGISKHYDNNSDVIADLPGVGIQFRIDNEDQRIITGPLMVAGMKIYRNDPQNGEYYVQFSKETIKKIAIKMARKGYQNNVNIMHDPNQKVDGVTLFEVFQTDKDRGIQAPKGYEDLPDGSLFGSMYVQNDNVWEAVKDGKIKGFSVEGNFGFKAKDKYEALLSEIIEVLSETE